MIQACRSCDIAIDIKKRDFIMLIKETKTDTIDYSENWPARYYDIPSGSLRLEYLEKAKEQGLTTAADIYREKLCKKRFFAKDNKGTTDGFLRAWMMIKASSAAGVSFFQKKSKKRELESYMEDLCLLHYESENSEEAAVLTEEWQDFARYFLSSCVGSKGYCSTLFGIVPIKDAQVAEKISAEISLVTKEYPALLGLEDAFAPLRNIMEETYQELIHVE